MDAEKKTHKSSVVLKASSHSILRAAADPVGACRGTRCGRCWPFGGRNGDILGMIFFKLGTKDAVDNENSDVEMKEGDQPDARSGLVVASSM